MPREDAAAKGRRLLTEGRVTLHHVDGREVIASVRGDSARIYSAGFRGHAWYCDCAALGRCSHVVALMLVVLAPTSTEEAR
jgi:uncharacterized Zn finger protein